MESKLQNVTTLRHTTTTSHDQLYYHHPDQTTDAAGGRGHRRSPVPPLESSCHSSMKTITGQHRLNLGQQHRY